jgi:hypothetical protein
MALLFVWIALGLAIVAGAAGIWLAVRSGLELWRELRRFRLAVVLKLEGLADRTETLVARSARAATAPDRLEPSVARLRTSLAELSVLTSAVQDVRDAAGRLIAIYPRK